MIIKIKANSLRKKIVTENVAHKSIFSSLRQQNYRIPVQWARMRCKPK